MLRHCCGWLSSGFGFQRTHRFWGATLVISCGYQRHFLRAWSILDARLTMRLHPEVKRKWKNSYIIGGWWYKKWGYLKLCAYAFGSECAFSCYCWCDYYSIRMCFQLFRAVLSNLQNCWEKYQTTSQSDSGFCLQLVYSRRKGFREILFWRMLRISLEPFSLLISMTDVNRWRYYVHLYRNSLLPARKLSSEQKF